MDRRIIPMTASHKVQGESRKENSLPAPMNSPHFLGASSRSDLDAGLPRFVVGSRLVGRNATVIASAFDGTNPTAS
jgi:hypothetical protein